MMVEDSPAVAKVRHILTILAVEDLSATVAFYTKAFGWEAPVWTPVYVEFSVPGGQRIGLYQREGFARNTGQQPARIGHGEIAPTELYLHADDLQIAIESLRLAGARELSPLAPRPWGDEAAYFADPEGNVLVVARPSPAAAQM